MTQSVSGLKEIFLNLDASIEEMDGAARETVISIAETVVKDGQRLAPRSEGRSDREDGALAESIGILSTEQTPEGFWVTVGTKLFYAIFVETGTERAKPHPFLRPPFAKAKATMNRRIRTIFKARVKALTDAL